MTETEITIADRLAALEAKQDAKAIEAAAVERALHAPPKNPGGAGFAKEQLYRQDAARYERVRLHEEWEREYDEQLARAKPKIERLTAKQRSLEADRVELRRRQTAEMADLERALGKVRREIDELSAPPEPPADPPSPDAVEMVAVDAGGSWGRQLVPRDVYDAQTRRQSGRRR
jgi:hypothetical protein